MKKLIVALANPFLLAFLIPFLGGFLLMMLIFSISITQINLLGKDVLLPVGDNLVFTVSEWIYKIVYFDNLKFSWAGWFSNRGDTSTFLFKVWFSLNVSFLLGFIGYCWRWLTFFYSVQFERQTMESDRRFMKNK
ncbi:hypothetical protein [Shewanella algae]|uniref:hypothetical protein n=1 Tax=Shewanella algae TaxID=38313 RepID=UPI0031F522B3